MTSPQDPSAPTQLAERHLPLVKSIALGLREQLPPSLELDDLISWGSQGLLEAAERYDPTRGATFSTFAYYRIRGAMYDGLRLSGRLSRTEWARVRALEHADDYLEQAAARDSAAPPEAQSNKTSQNTLRQVATHVAAITTIHITSLDARLHPDVPDARAENAYDAVDTIGLRPHLKQALTQLDERERALIDLCYYQDKSLAEAARTMHLSKSWASRIHGRAIHKMQHFFAKRDAAIPAPRTRPP